MFASIYNLLVDLVDIINPYIFPFIGVGLILYTIHLIFFLLGGREHV